MNRETAGGQGFIGKGRRAGPEVTPLVWGPASRRKFWRPVGWHNPPLGFRVQGLGAPRPRFWLSGPGSPLTLCFSPPRSQDTAQSPSTGLPATVTRPHTTRRSFPTTLSSTRTPWASRALWVSRRERCGVLLPSFRATPVPGISNPQHMVREGTFRNNQPNLTQFKRKD